MLPRLVTAPIRNYHRETFMKASWETISIGLDQLFFGKMIADESIESRSDTIEKFLVANGWSWDEVLDMMGKEDDLLQA